MIDLIIPTYNAIKTLERCLESIKNQTIIKDVKVFIIDDNSTDDYREIIKKYSEFMDLRHYKLTENHGPGYARQYGIDHSYDEYIVFIDSDDVFYETISLARLRDEIVNTQSDVVNSNFKKQKKNLEEYIDFLNDYINVHGKIYRRSFLFAHNIRFPELPGEEDNAFNHLLLMYNPKISYINQYTYKNLYNSSSITENNEGDYFNNYIYLYTEAFLFALEQAIKDGCPKSKIGYWAADSLLVTYTRYVFLHLKIEGNKEIKNTKRLIEIYEEYYQYLSDDSLKQVIDTELYKPYYKELLSTTISFKKFINLIKKDNLKELGYDIAIKKNKKS
jgi:glycosyltransferase involved in cell wall biosynthesis